MIRNIKAIAAVLLCLFILGGCGETQEQEEVLSTVEVDEIDAVEHDLEMFAAEEPVTEDSTQETEPVMEDSASQTLRVIPTEENGILEIYDGRNEISVSEDIMIAQIAPRVRL